MYKIILSLLLLASTSFAQTTKKACFLGNSYTYFNDMPGIVESMATADGNTLIKDQNTPGGYTLNGHSTYGTSLGVIASDQWDYVVLQDQSQLPSFPWGQVQTEVLPYAEVLVDSIRSANECAVPLFFNTWGREIGDPQWDSINTFDKMNQRLYNAYGYMAEKHCGKRSPVGMGFNHIQDDVAPVVTHADLYTGDGSHPTIFGSYLAACMFYEIIFEEDCQGNTFLPTGVTNTEATYLQFVAHHVVNDVDSIEVDFTQPTANFTFSQAGMDAMFTNLSECAFTYSWDFGDGNTSTDENPTHTYGNTGTYDVTLTAEYCGNTHDTTFQVSFFSGIDEGTVDIQIYPNPSNGTITIQTQQAGLKAELLSLDGKLLEVLPTNQAIQLNLQSGMYLIQIGTRTERLLIE